MYGYIYTYADTKCAHTHIHAQKAPNGPKGSVQTNLCVAQSQRAREQ